MLLRAVATEIGVTARTSAAIRPASRPNWRPTSWAISQTEATAARAPGQEEADAVVAEDPRRERLDPEAQRRLVEGDEAARVERSEEEVRRAREHAPDGGRVVEVRPALPVEGEELEEAGQDHDQGERHVVAG